MIQNYQEGSKMAEKVQMGQEEQKWSKKPERANIQQNIKNRLMIVLNSPRWSTMVLNVPKWSKMFQKDP
jgi:hypothetical protein